MPRLVRTRLSAMMFLFYFALGSWAVTLSTYLMSAPIKGGLNFSTQQVGWIYSTFAFGGMLAPLVVGLLADRLFAAQRVLGVTGLLCAGLLFLAANWCDTNFPRMDEAYRQAAAQEQVQGRPVLEQYARLEAASGVAAPAAINPLRDEVRRALDRVNDNPAVRSAADAAFGPLFALMLAYCISLQLGLTLTTVTTLRNLPDPGGFSRTRLFGTVGWIVTGNVVGLALTSVSSEPLYLATAATAIFAVYAFTLPSTPPKGTGRSVAEAFGLPALRLFRDRSFTIFVIVAFISTAMNQFYGVYAHRYLTDLGIGEPVQIMTLGQVCEVGVMFAIPWLGPRRRMKVLMVAGLIGWVVRGFTLTWGWIPAVIAVGVPMHGWSYAFYFIVAATYLDREAPPTLRASAQGIITFVSGGIGVWAGNLFAGWVVDAHRTGTVIDWSAVWQVPMIGSAIALLIFVVMFRQPPVHKTP